MQDEFSDNPFDSPSLIFNGIYFPEDGSAAEVRGSIGGEAQYIYAALFRKDEQITIDFSFVGDREMTEQGLEASASFSVNNKNLEFSDFGQESDDGKSWSGTIPEAGPYFITVVAHPFADFTLKVTRT